MKYLHVISSINPEQGGPIEGIRLLSTEMLRNGHKPEVVTLDAPDQDFIKSFPAKVYALGPTNGKYGYNNKLLPWLKMNASNYDIVIVNGIWQYSGFAAWRALAGKKTPYFVFTHGMLDPWFKHAYPLKHLKKWLYWPWAEYRVLRDARAVIFTCEEERLLARQSFWLYRANEAVTSYGTSSPIGNGEELAKKFTTKFPDLKDKRIVLFLSRIHEKKGCDILIESFAQVANQDKKLHLVMAGPDQSSWIPALQSQAKKLGVADRISWPGMLKGEDKWGAFNAAEVFCLPSHQENFGIVVAEALACGKPVLISNKVNIWREIESDAAGFVADDSVSGTVHNLQRWLELDKKSYSEASERARECFKQRFHIQRSATRLLEIVKENTDLQ